MVSLRRQLDVGIVISVRGSPGLGRVRVPRAAGPAPRPQRRVRAAVRARARAHAGGVHLRALEGAYRRTRARYVRHRQGLPGARRQPLAGRSEEQERYEGTPSYVTKGASPLLPVLRRRDPTIHVAQRVSTDKRI